MVKSSVVKAVRHYLRLVSDSGIPVSFGVVFGSQVTGKTDKWSDIDLVVVSSVFDKKKAREFISRLWQLTLQADTRIEPIPAGEREWRNPDSSPIVEIARRSGKMVSIA